MTALASTSASLSAFAPAAIRALSATRGEAPALMAARLAALERFDPNAVQDSRYTRVTPEWRTMALSAPASGPCPLPSEAFDASNTNRLPLSTYLADHPEALASLFASHRSPWDGLALAAWHEGDALLWKAGERSAQPTLLTRGGQPGFCSAPVLLDVGEGAEASAALYLSGVGATSLNLTALRGTVKPGGRLKLFVFSDGGEGKHVLSLDLDLLRDARVEVFGAWLGGKWSVARLHGRLSEPGASWTETQIAAGDAREHHDWDTQVVHAAPHTTSDIQAKTALAGRARAVLTGNIRMEQIAAGSAANLTSHVLMLSPGARADSLPGLEIETLDVKASHAASVGQPDEEHLLYLMSRGLDATQARRLVVAGFLAAALARNPLPELGEAVADRIETFFGGRP